jgi:hypothetical protein
MAGEWVGIAETTIRDYIRDVEVDVIRNRKILAMLQSRGRVTFNHSGTDMDWKVRYKRGQMKGYSDLDTVTFVRRNRHKTAVLGYRAYTMDEQISKMDRLKNRGTPAIVKILEEKVTVMAEDMEDNFGDIFYLDGNATGREKDFHGIESFMGTGSASSTAPIYLASDTYAGINTDQGYYGGTWTGNWPVGTGPAEYDFYSPLLVDYTATLATASGGWSASTKTWANTCLEATRYGIIHSRKNKSKKGQIDFVLLNDELYRLFVEQLATKERITVVQGGGQSGDTLTGLGFSDVVNYEGCEITAEYGMPSNTGYGFNVDFVELASMQDKLFVTTGPFENENDKSIRFSIDCFGNLKFVSPRYFFKLKNFT